MVSYPDRAGKPGSIADRRDRPDIGGVKGGDRLKIGEVNVGGRNKGLTRPGNVIGDRNIGDRSWSNDKRWSDNKIWGNGNNIGNDININIDNSFRNNNNFSYRPGYWGARPWWGAGSYHGWHHGHCHCGWSAGYYHRHWYYHDNDDFAKGFMWGIGVWSLGNLIYNMGYNQYSNPYQAPPVQNTYITYEQPVSVAAAANPPAEVQVATEASEPAEIADTELGEEKSAEALDKSRAAFRSGDYPGALKSVDVALAYTPSDVSLHEFRALIYFALGKYAEAAGILNPVLASGPGWSWETMAGFYTQTATYEEQFRKLEEFSKSTPDRADVHFLLGYHYMVTGHMEESNAQFAKAAELQPADTIATQLRDLTADSIPVETPTDNPEPRPEPVDLKELQGTWISETDGGTITFTLKESGDYSWVFGESKLEGTYGLDDQGLLVLTTDDSQMVSVIEMKGETGFHFTLVGSPSGDPGLDFKKS